jgi:hypothetical protein
MTFEINTELTKRDWVEFQLFHRLRSRQARRRRLLFAFVPPLLIIGFLFTALMLWVPRPLGVTNTLLPLLLILPLYLILFYDVTRRRLQAELDRLPETDRSILGKYQIIISLDGVTALRDSKEIFTPWLNIPSVIANRDCGYIYTSADKALIIPHRFFPDDASFTLFIKSAIIFHWNHEKTAAANPDQRTFTPEPVVAPPPIPLKQSLPC